MTQVSFIDLAGLLDDAGFAGGVASQTGIAIVCAESGRYPDEKHVNPDGSIDRGLWQINSKWHPEVTDAMAYDPVLATKEAARIGSKGSNYGAWATFTGGGYKVHMEAAGVALAGHALKLKLATCQDANAVAQVQLASSQAQLAAAQAELKTAQDEVVTDEAMIATLRAMIDAAVKALTA